MSDLFDVLVMDERLALNESKFLFSLMEVSKHNIKEAYSLIFVISNIFIYICSCCELKEGRGTSTKCLFSYWLLDFWE